MGTIYIGQGFKKKELAETEHKTPWCVQCLQLSYYCHYDIVFILRIWAGMD